MMYEAPEPKLETLKAEIKELDERIENSSLPAEKQSLMDRKNLLEIELRATEEQTESE